MHYSIINSYYPIFNKCMAALVKRLEQQEENVEFNVYEYLERSTLEMISC